MRRLCWLPLLALAAGCPDNSATDTDGPVRHDLAVHRDLHPGAPDLVSGSDDGGATDDLAAPPDEGGLPDLASAADLRVTAAPDMTGMPAPDMTGTPAPDMTGMPAPDMTGTPAPDLAGTPPPDLAGMLADLAATPSDLSATPPSDLSGTPPADLGGAPPADLSGAGADGGVIGGPILAGDFVLLGVTTDGYAVIEDTTADDVKVIPLAGGMPTSIGGPASASDVGIDGQAVFVWQNVTSNSIGDVGSLVVWTAAAGTTSVANRSLAYLGAASPDGTRVMFTANVSTFNQSGRLIGGAPDLSTAWVLQDPLELPPTNGNASCAPALGFAGQTGISATCDFTAATPAITSWDVIAGNGTVLLPSAADFFSIDDAGDALLLIDDAGAPIVTDPAGTSMLTLDAVDAAAFGYIYPDGSAAVWRTPTGKLQRSPAATAMPSTLVAMGANRFKGTTPDGHYLVYRNQVDNATGLTDLNVTSTVTATAPVVLDATTDGEVDGEPATRDGKWVLYSTAVDVSGAVHSGTLQARPVAGGAQVTLGTKVVNVLASTGSKVVIDDGFDATGFVADIHVGDPAKGAATSLLVGKADAPIFLSPARDQVVYTMSSGTHGLYVTLIP